MSEFLRNTLNETKHRFTDRDYVRWHARQKFIKLGLVILSMVLLAPLIVALKAFNAPPALGFGVMLVSVLFLVVLYAIVGMVLRQGEPRNDSPGVEPPFGPGSPSTVSSQPPVMMGAVPPRTAPAMPNVGGAPQPGFGGPQPMAQPQQRSAGKVLLAMFGGCAVMVVLFCGGLGMLAVLGGRRAPNVQNQGAHPMGAPAFMEEQMRRQEEFHKEHQKRFEEMRKRQDEMFRN